MSTLRKSFVWSFAQKYFAIIVSLVTLPILARILTPEEVGIFTVSVAFVALAHMVRDFGIADYLVQEKELTRDRQKAAFGVAIVIGWSVGALLFVLSVPVSWIYEEPGVRKVMSVLALNFFVIPFSVPVLALLRRNMAFGVRSRIMMASSLVHGTTSVALAFAGFGYMSLAWASLAGVTTTALLSSRHRPKGIGWMPSLGEWRRIASFGGTLTIAQIANIAGERAVDFILARVLGFNAAGLYSRGEGLLNLFRQGALQAILPVVLPALSERHRAGEDIKPSYLLGIAHLTGVAWPFFAFVAIMAYPIIRVLFGPQWDGAVPVAQVLCIAAAIGMPWEFAGQVMVAIGRVRRELFAQIMAIVPQVGALLLLAMHGIEYAALALAVRNGMLGAVHSWNLRRFLNIHLPDVVRATWRSLGLTVLASLGPLGVQLTLPIGPESVWVPLLWACAGAGVGWLAGLFLLDHPLKAEVSLYINNMYTLIARRSRPGESGV